MPGSQVDLKNQVDKYRKRGVTGLDQYNDQDMKGFKRKQIDELIRDCNAMDPDHRFEYNIASIKRDIRRRQSGLETSAMQVILKRQLRNGVAMQGPSGNIRLPTSGIVDLSGAEEYEKSSQNSSHGHKPGAFPFERHLSEPWVHVGHHEARPPAHHAHSHEHANPHDHGNTHGHGDSGGKDAHGQEQPFHNPFMHEETHDAKHGHEEKAKKPKNKEHKSPKIVQGKKHEGHKSHDYSDSSSSSDSDSSSGDTDQTPDTVISSEDSHYHHKKHHKSKHHRKSSSHDHEPIREIYREHRRREPARRLSSPPPSHRSHYRHEDVYIEPSFTHRHRPEPSYPSERLSYHHRAMSYDDERLHDHDMRGLGRRPSVYRRRITSTAHPMDPYEEDRREIWEKEEAMRRRERLHREATRGFHAPQPRRDRMHGYHDDYLTGFHDDRY